MNENYYIIKRLNDVKFLYKIKNEWRNNLHNRIIKTPCFTRSSDVYFLESLELAENALNICICFKNDQTKKPINQLKSNYEIIEISLLEKNLIDQIINAERGKFVFKIKDTDCNKFVKEKEVGEYRSRLILSETHGKLFVEYSVVQNYKKYMIQDFNGWGGVVGHDEVKRLKKRFEIITYKPQAHVYKKVLLIEKVKPKKKKS